jgi:hypothetical protein
MLYPNMLFWKVVLEVKCVYLICRDRVIVGDADAFVSEVRYCLWCAARASDFWCGEKNQNV